VLPPGTAVVGALFTLDGKGAVTASVSTPALTETVTLWDVATGKSIWIAEEKMKPTQCLALSPDGKLVATAGNRVTLWDATTGKRLHSLGLDTSIDTLAFSPDSALIATASAQIGDVDIWDTRTGAKLRTIQPDNFAGTGIKFLPDGELITTGSGVQLWDPATGAKIGGAGPKGGLFSDDGEKYFAGSERKATLVCATRSGETLCTLKMDERGCSPGGLVFSPAGDRIVSTFGCGALWCWYAKTGDIAWKPREHSRGFEPAAFSPDGKLLVTGSDVCAAIIWDAATGHKLLTLVGHVNGIESVSFSPDGKLALTGSGDGTAILWDSETGNLLRVLAPPGFKPIAEDRGLGGGY